jgi:hypothetical protein
MIDWLETIPYEKKLRSDVKKKYPRIRRLYHIIVSLDYQLTTTTLHLRDMDVLTTHSSALLPRNN